MTGPAKEFGADELLRRARAGDDSSFWQLCEGMRPQLKQIAAQTIGGDLNEKMDSSDIVQNAVTAALRSIGSFRGESYSDWQAWMRQVTKNEALDARRYWSQQKRRITRSHSLENDAPLAAEVASPSTVIQHREAVAQALRHLERLSEDERLVVRLRYLEGLPLDAIALAIGRTDSATAGVLKRAMAKLRQIAIEDGDLR